MLAQLSARLRARQAAAGGGGANEEGGPIILDDNCTVSFYISPFMRRGQCLWLCRSCSHLGRSGHRGVDIYDYEARKQK